MPTMLTYAAVRQDDAARQRARRMLDWLVSIQRPDGGIQGGVIGARPVVSVTFNTGQVLLGLASGVREFGDAYRPALRQAAEWLVQTQDADGCWRKYPSPFASRGEKTYDTHVAWGLLEAARVEPESRYADAALANVRWALGLQHDNGWFDKCCLTDRSQPLTHTLGYVLRGILEAYRFTGDSMLLSAARRTADGLLAAMRVDGFLPGRLDQAWRGTVAWECLTGTAQIAYGWLMLAQDTGCATYRHAAYAANRYLRRTMRVEGPAEIRGAIKGSRPVDGGYATFEYPSWAAKFFIDANLLELTVRAANQEGDCSLVSLSPERSAA